MPRRRVTGVGSAFHQVQRQARFLLQNLQKEIRSKEAELKRLKEEGSRLTVLTRRARATGGEAGLSALGRRGSRISWRAVLSQLPRQFKATDLRRIRGLERKGPSEISAAITRWIKADMVKRKTRGQYEQVGNGDWHGPHAMPSKERRR